VTSTFADQHTGEMLGSIKSMKISVNIPDDQVEFVDSRVSEGLYSSRSAAFSEALRMWRLSELEAGYEEAFSEVDSAWDAVEGEGLSTEGESW
jgi:Arc/MetJ-type ribon-helix-helix transcriptional regulator